MPSSWGLSIPNIKISLVLSIIFTTGYIITTPKTVNYVKPVTATSTVAIKEELKPVALSSKQEIVKKIAVAFPNNKEVMLAIAIEESGLNPNAINYNCRYKIGGSTYDKLTQLNIDLNTVIKERKAGYVSTWCRKGHEKFAWSVDGSLFQINGVSKLSVDESIKRAKIKYETQGLTAWVAYKTGGYKKHLETARELLETV